MANEPLTPLFNGPNSTRRRSILSGAVHLSAWAGWGLLQRPGSASAKTVSTPRTLANGLDFPWSLAFLPDGRMLVTQKSGSMLTLDADGRPTGAPLAGVPGVTASGQGGLLDVVLDPDFERDPWIYFAYAEPGSGAEAGKAGTAVARARLAGHGLRDLEVIFRQWPKVNGSGHFGARLVFRRDKTLLVTLGERQLKSPAQDLSNHLGKVVRLRRDGRPAADNPPLGPNARAEIWSYGHRNPQGAALHPGTGDLWVVEHGPQGGDELNIARAGNNHGWPLRSYGCNYGDPPGTDCQIGAGRHAPEFVEPLTTWVPRSIAPSGLCFYTANLIPEWKGNLFVGALAGRALWRLTLEGETVVAREPLFQSLLERIRDVRQGPDGALYLLTDSSNGRILRIAP